MRRQPDPHTFSANIAAEKAKNSCGKWAAKVSRTLHDRSTGPFERGGCPRQPMPLEQPAPGYAHRLHQSIWKIGRT
jgi:hypothetical protein